MMEEQRKVKITLIAGCLLCFFFSLHAQSVKDNLAKADRYYERKDFENAIKHYLEALQLDDGDARTNFRVGMAYLGEENFSRAVHYLGKAYSLDPAIDPNIDYHLGIAYQEDHQYGKAMEHFQAVRAKNKSLSAVANQKIALCKLADSLMRLPPNATVTPLAEGINSAFAEISPLLTPDGKTLFFTSNRSENEYEIKSGTNYEDVYVSRKDGQGWAPPEKISRAINVKLNDAAVAVSPDGKTLYLYYDEGGGDIYSATLENGKWTKPVPLNRFINHPQYRESSACVSPDGKKLFFSSNRAGGKGGFDLYVSELSPNGQWGRPSNLGSTINTRRDEEMPFLHADGTTLYFSSNGHATLGKSDIFRTTLRDGHWTKPENLGHPINTSADDRHFVLSRDGKTGYYCRQRRNQPGNTDIFHVVFQPQSQVAAASQAMKTGAAGQSDTHAEKTGKVTVLKGKVIDVATTTPLEATITLVDNASKDVISAVQTGASGDFELVIPRQGNYGVTTAKEGYLFNSMNFNLPAFEKYQEIDTHILMVKAQVGSKIVLKNIFFDLNQSELKPESLSELQNIRNLLQQHPGWRIQINGHTDNIGHPTVNLALSLKRAQAVMEYLIKEGIAAGRLQAKGFGSERPLVSNDDEKEGRQINRRTEIEIIE